MLKVVNGPSKIASRLIAKFCYLSQCWRHYFLGTLSREIRSVYLEEQLYPDDFVSLTLEGVKGRLEAKKGALVSKGLAVNVKKKEILISSEKGLLSQCKAS